MKHSLSLAVRTAIPALAVLALGLSTTARADFQFATDFNPTISAFPDFNTGTYGYQMLIGNAPLQVTGLASAYDVAGDVRIYQDGASTDVAGVTLTDTNFATSPFGNTYVYETLPTPVTLNANTTYDIVWDNPDFGQAFSFATSGVSLNPDITLGGGISDFLTGTHPTGDFFGMGSYFGPSLQIGSTPEPGAFASFGIGGIMSLLYTRRRRKAQAK